MYNPSLENGHFSLVGTSLYIAYISVLLLFTLFGTIHEV